MGGTSVEDEAWKTHISRVLKEDDAINWSGYSLMQASNRSVNLEANNGYKTRFDVEGSFLDILKTSTVNGAF